MLFLNVTVSQIYSTAVFCRCLLSCFTRGTGLWSVLIQQLFLDLKLKSKLLFKVAKKYVYAKLILSGQIEMLYVPARAFRS